MHVNPPPPHTHTQTKKTADSHELSMQAPLQFCSECIPIPLDYIHLKER
jgi:hypothetical protein